MLSKALEIPRDHAPEPVEAPARRSTLTWRASLNVVQSLLDYSAKLGVGLIVVPILVSGLGRTMFGVWEMLGRLVGYIESNEGRSTQALRLVIANQQSSEDRAAKRRWIGAALVVWACFLPLWVVAGALLVWLAPTITKVPPEFHTTVRVACALMMVGVMLAGLGSLPASVLRGMNLGYKRMGIQAGLSVVGGALLAGAAYWGFGLPGVAVAGILLAVLTGFCFLALVTREVPWFGAERPRRQEVRSLLGMSLWIALGDLGSSIMASDVLVVGMLLSSSAVTTYVLTGYAARLAINLHSLAAEAVMPGVAGIIGERRFERAAILRRELFAVTWIFITAIGSTILLLNRSFIHLWVGGENYGGTWVNLVLVLIAAQSVFIRCDSYLIDAALQPAKRVRVSTSAAVFILALSIVMTHWAGMLGLCLGILAGRMTLIVAYPILVRGCLARTPALSMTWLARPLLLMGLMFASSAYLGQLFLVRHWITWGAAVLLTLILTLGTAFILGLPRDMRGAVQRRIVEIARRRAGQS